MNSGHFLTQNGKRKKRIKNVACDVQNTKISFKVIDENRHQEKFPISIKHVLLHHFREMLVLRDFLGQWEHEDHRCVTHIK